MSDLESATKGANIIPFLYYDLIARILPGTFLVLALLVAYGAFSADGFLTFNKLLTANATSIVIVSLVVLCSGYCTGMLIASTFGQLVKTPITRRVWKRVSPDYANVIKSFCDCFNVIVPKGKNGDLALNNFAPGHIDRIVIGMHDHLRNTNVLAGSLLPKLRAEFGLCSNFAAALFMWLVLSAPANQLVTGSYLPSYKVMVAWCLLMGLFLWAAWYRQKNFLRRQFIFFLRELAKISEQGGGATAVK